MAKVKDCPKCRLVNPPSAQRCDCGYDFVTATVEGSYLGTAGTARIEGPSIGELALCVLLPLIGLFAGLIARGRGRRSAGRTMVIVSGVMLAVCNAPLLLAILAGAIGSLNK